MVCDKLKQGLEIVAGLARVQSIASRTRSLATPATTQAKCPRPVVGQAKEDKMKLIYRHHRLAATSGRRSILCVRILSDFRTNKQRWLNDDRH